MPRKGMRSVSFHPSPPHRSSTSPTLAVDAFRATLMEDNVASAEQLITKWDPEGSSFAKITSLFYESRDEARRFLLAVQNVHQAMCFFSSAHKSSSHHLLVRGQRLMETAMARLQREFYQILADNRDHLDLDSVSSVHSLFTKATSTSFSDLEDEYFSEADEIRAAGENVERAARPTTAVMIDLRAIAQCMVSCGYAHECVATYKSIRRSIVDEGLYGLGFDRLSPSRIKKLDWHSLERRVTNWLTASGVAILVLFSGERALCDFVFASSDYIKEPCFAEITRDAAVQFLGFPELAALSAKGKRSPEKLFHFLDMYSSISELWPEIEEIFSYESTANVRSQVQFTQHELGEYVRASLADFEASLQKDSSKVTVRGGGIHPLTQHTMDYMVRFAGYGGPFVEIYANCPVPTPRAPLPEPFHSLIYPSSVPSSPCSTFDEDYLEVPPNVSSRMAWLLLLLLCKLDRKADLYRDRPLAYLFLANNLHYVVSRVRRSKLSSLLGGDWEGKHERKARSFARTYERLAWSGVLDSIPRDPAALLEDEGVGAARECMKRFNKELEAAYRKQADWVVMDWRTSKELRGSIAMKVVESYGAFYERCREVLRADRDSIGVVRFAPEDVHSYVARLFSDGNGSSASASSGLASPSLSSGSGSSDGSRCRRLGLPRLTRWWSKRAREVVNGESTC